MLSWKFNMLLKEVSSVKDYLVTIPSVFFENS